MKRKLVTIAVLAACMIASLSMTSGTSKKDPYVYGKDSIGIVNSSPSIQMYFYIKKYAKLYDIPEAYAFSLAYQETNYRGPLHFSYNPEQVSTAGALGPMQIMPNTFKMVNKKSISNRRLKSDIQLNVMTSMKLLRMLHNQYQDWGLAFGAYNTGKPCINEYSQNILNKEFFWISGKI